MLKNISSVISPDLLWLLASMGHGDDLVLVDRNFPAIQVAKQTSTGRLIELSGLNIPQATRAILSLMPLDHFVEEPVTRILPPIFTSARACGREHIEARYTIWRGLGLDVRGEAVFVFTLDKAPVKPGCA
jgi:hypothetical protein